MLPLPFAENPHGVDPDYHSGAVPVWRRRLLGPPSWSLVGVALIDFLAGRRRYPRRGLRCDLSDDGAIKRRRFERLVV
jgi:hypothetical protein